AVVGLVIPVVVVDDEPAGDRGSGQGVDRDSDREFRAVEVGVVVGGDRAKGVVRRRQSDARAVQAVLVFAVGVSRAHHEILGDLVVDTADNLVGGRRLQMRIDLVEGRGGAGGASRIDVEEVVNAGAEVDLVALNLVVVIRVRPLVLEIGVAGN